MSLALNNKQDFDEPSRIFVQFLGLAVYKDPASRIRLPPAGSQKVCFSESHPILDFPRMKEAQE